MINKLQTKNAGNEQSLGAWSFLGFELFDLLIVLIHVAVVWSAVPLDWLFAHPVLRFVAGVGFFISLYYLSQTKQYGLGVRAIGEFHGSLWFVLIVSGAIAGAFIFGMFIVGPIKDFLNVVGITDMSILTLIAIPFGVVSLGVIPCVAIAADEKLNPPDVDEDGMPRNDSSSIGSGNGGELDGTPSLDEVEGANSSDFLELPIWTNYLGRGFFLLAAATLLFYVEKAFEGNSDDFVMRLILSTFMLSIFYIPVRVQEMFLRHQGPHFQSLIQTIIAVAMLKSSIAYF